MKKEWQRRKLGDVCEIMNGGTPKTGVPEYWDGSHLWITPAEMGKRLSPYVGDTERKITDLGLGNSSARMLPSNSVILSSRAPIGHLVINTKTMATNQGCKGLIPGSKLQHKFLYYYLSSIVELLNALGTGATFKELSGGKLKEVTIPIPPLTEQQRIVGILDEAFEGIATAKTNAEASLQDARDLSESILAAAIDGATTREWRESHPNAEPASELLKRILAQRRKRWNRNGEYKEPASPGPDSLPVLPEGWTYATVEQLLRDDGGLSYGILKPGDPDPQGVPMIRVMDIGRGKLNDTDILRVSRTLSDEFRRTILEEDDLMLAVMATVGRCAIVPPHLVGSNVNRALAVLKLTKLVNVKFILYAVLSTRIQTLFQTNKVGAAQARINLGDLRCYRIPLPPLSEQERIVEILDALSADTERLESIYLRKIVALEALKKSLLHQAFSGNL